MHVILIEEQACLVFRVGGKVMGTSVPKVFESIVLNSVETAMSDGCPDTCHEIDPQGNLRTIKGCLLDITLGTIGHIGNNHFVLLVRSITEEVAFEYAARSFQFSVQQSVIGVEDRFQLLSIGQSGIVHVNHHMVFLHLSVVVKLINLGMRLLEWYCL